MALDVDVADEDVAVVAVADGVDGEEGVWCDDELMN